MRDDFSLVEVIEEALPYDGPHDAGTVREAASGLAALVRYLNNATWPHQGTLRRAPRVDRVVGSVKAAAYLLDQMLGQLADSLGRLEDDPAVYDDRRDRSPVEALRSAQIALGDARVRARGLAIALEDAHSHTSHLGHDVPVGGER